MSGAPRTYLAGHEAIERAFAQGEPVRVLLVGVEDHSAATGQLVRLAEDHAARVWRGGPGDLRRMSRSREPQSVMALLGAKPEAELDDLLTRGGISWLLHRASYPSNAGFVVRTAEVSGADGVVIDAQWNHQDRSRVRHVSMGASLLLPVIFDSWQHVVERAHAHDVRVVAIEDVGDNAPWQVDLREKCVCVIGGERDGIDPVLLTACDAVVRVPMAGFVPSYNLQAAMAAVAVERLRQLTG
ncbi:MAG TPA: TrmH family RNA methyltransferase [Polyangiales bacterium]